MTRNEAIAEIRDTYEEIIAEKCGGGESSRPWLQKLDTILTAVAAPASVFLLTIGDGSDGDEWHVRGIYTTREKAEAAKAAYEAHHHYRPDGSWYTNISNDIEEWATDEPPTLCPQPGYDPGELHVGCPRCRGTLREPLSPAPPSPPG